MSIELKRATPEMRIYIYDFIDEWIKNGEEVVPASVRLAYYDFDTWLKNTLALEKRETCPPNLVPAYTYFMFMGNDRILGAINIRHCLNDYLFNYGGHIGYGIRPSERRKGYGTLILSMAIPIVKELGINKILVTCNKKNIASAKVILKNGGVLENEVFEDGEITQRYWIEV